MATELVGIELQLRGEEGVFKDMQKLDTMIKQIGGRHTVELELGKSQQRVLELTGAMNELKATIKDNEQTIRDNAKTLKEYKTAVDSGEMSIEECADACRELAKENLEARKAIDQAKESLSAYQTEAADARQETRELTTALRNVKPLKTVFNDIALSVARVGSALQSAGNAMTRFSAPIRMLLGGAVMGAGYNILGKVTEGIESGFSRYDTMKKYVAVMNAFGYSMEQAEQSKQKLDASVRGLPTGLDEIMNMAQRFTATVGDLEKGTDLAIAANNAFLASMSTETQQYQGMMQLQDVLGGKDMNAREWNSLVSSMTPAIVKMGESLGYTNKNMDEFIQMVRDGDMANKDFIDTLIKVGTGEGSVAKMAEISKQTYEAFSRNIKNAFSRMGYGVLTSLDEVIKIASSGKIQSLNQLLIDNVIPAIDRYTESIKAWIQAHPQELIDYFNSLKSIDWKGLFRGFVEGLGDMANSIKRLADIAGHFNLSLLGKIFAKSGPIGWFLTVFGGLLKGSRHIWAGLGTLITALLRHFGASGGLGFFGAIKRFFGGKDADKTLTEAPTFMGSLKRAFSSLEGVIKIAGAIGIAAGTGFVAFKSFKSMMSDLKGIIDITSQIDWEKGAGVITAMGTFFAAFAGLGKFASMNMSVVGDILAGEVGVGLLTTVAAAFGAVDLWLIKTGAEQLEGAIDAVSRSIEKMGEIKTVPGGIRAKVKNAVGALNDIIDLFAGKSGGPKDQGETQEGLKGFSEASSKTINNVKSALEAIIKSSEYINEVNALELNTDNIETIASNFDTALQAIGNIFSRDNLPEAFYYGEGGIASTDFATTLKGMKEALEHLLGSDGIIAKLREFASTSDLSRISNIAAGRISTVLNALKRAFVSLLVDDGGDYASAATKMKNLADAVDSMKLAFEALKELEKIELGTKGENGTGDFKAIANIEKLISQLERAFETNKINALNSQISGFVDTVNALLEQVNSINADEGNITIEINLKDKIVGDETVVKDIRNIDTKVRRAINAIQTSYTKTIYVNLNMSGVVSGASVVRQMAQNALNSVRPAKGGMIYRAKGGRVPMFPGRPQGTDRVPAWLTAGEYVHNKKAVDTFGIDFMRKVNNLDMKGAMNELMHRAGNMASINRGTNITNNHYNNQRVTINNNSAGAGFTFRSASRFVGAF